MSYTLVIKPELDKIFSKLFYKNKVLYDSLMKKVTEILENPQHYKNLRKPLHDWKRGHIGKSFVLCFSVDENTKTVILEDFDHHDRIYKIR